MCGLHATRQTGCCLLLEAMHVMPRIWITRCLFFWDRRSTVDMYGVRTVHLGLVIVGQGVLTKCGKS